MPTACRPVTLADDDMRVNAWLAILLRDVSGKCQKITGSADSAHVAQRAAFAVYGDGGLIVL